MCCKLLTGSLKCQFQFMIFFAMKCVGPAFPCHIFQGLVFQDFIGWLPFLLIWRVPNILPDEKLVHSAPLARCIKFWLQECCREKIHLVPISLFFATYVLSPFLFRRKKCAFPWGMLLLHLWICTSWWSLIWTPYWF